MLGFSARCLVRLFKVHELSAYTLHLGGRRYLFLFESSPPLYCTGIIGISRGFNSKALVAHLDRVVWRQLSDDLSQLSSLKAVCRSKKCFKDPYLTSTWSLLKRRYHDVIMKLGGEDESKEFFWPEMNFREVIMKLAVFSSLYVMTPLRY